MTAGATVWGAYHLPQNREVFMVAAGDGSLYLYKYHYPDQRTIKVRVWGLGGGGGRLKGQGRGSGHVRAGTHRRGRALAVQRSCAQLPHKCAH